jgi:hypothetical protein
MVTFFHVSAIDHAIGQVLQPGSWGKATQKAAEFQAAAELPIIENETALNWEYELEKARSLVKPAAPSRLHCVFACNTLAHARAFRDSYYPAASIFEVDAADDAGIYVGDFGLTTAQIADEFWAKKYWSDAPSGSGIQEVLIGGPVTIVRKL